MPCAEVYHTMRIYAITCGSTSFRLPGALLPAHLAREVENEIVARGPQSTGTAEILGMGERVEPAGHRVHTNGHPGFRERLSDLSHRPEGFPFHEPCVAAMSGKLVYCLF